jgi:hypothetical protein
MLSLSSAISIEDIKINLARRSALMDAIAQENYSLSLHVQVIEDYRSALLDRQTLGGSELSGCSDGEVFSLIRHLLVEATSAGHDTPVVYEEFSRNADIVVDMCGSTKVIQALSSLKTSGLTPAHHELEQIEALVSNQIVDFSNQIEDEKESIDIQMRKVTSTLIGVKSRTALVRIALDKLDSFFFEEYMKRSNAQSTQHIEFSAIIRALFDLKAPQKIIHKKLQELVLHFFISNQGLLAIPNIGNLFTEEVSKYQESRIYRLRLTLMKLKAHYSQLEMSRKQIKELVVSLIE